MALLRQPTDDRQAAAAGRTTLPPPGHRRRHVGPREARDSVRTPAGRACYRKARLGEKDGRGEGRLSALSAGLTPVRAEDQSATWLHAAVEQMVDELLEVAGGNAVAEGVGVREASRWTPGPSVRDEEVGGEPGQPSPRQGDEICALVDAEGRDAQAALGAPCDQRLEKEPVRATDVEEVGGSSSDRLEDGLALRPPTSWTAAKARLVVGVRLCEVRLRERLELGDELRG